MVVFRQKTRQIFTRNECQWTAENGLCGQSTLQRFQRNKIGEFVKLITVGSSFKKGIQVWMEKNVK